ncbi:unnamed protein product [Rangifer tarandus platyrhynchus]|uniref:Uncharacterized protein n=1 Tax=Rangifer tarandus platyrhynchus TaxID=3082113 RepID=A0AC59YJD1_RANTA
MPPSASRQPQGCPLLTSGPRAHVEADTVPARRCHISLVELAEDAASLRVKSEPWFWRPRRPYGEPWAVSMFVPIRTDHWYLKRSCPCSFRLICDETNMVHFFFGIKSQLEEPPGPHGTSRKGLWCPCLSGSPPAKEAVVCGRSSATGPDTASLVVSLPFSDRTCFGSVSEHGSSSGVLDSGVKAKCKPWDPGLQSEIVPLREVEGDPALSCLCLSVVLEEKLFVVDSLYL